MIRSRFEDVFEGLKINTVLRHWPLCYTRIGYRRSMVRRELYQSKSVNHDFSCQHRGFVDSWTFKCVSSAPQSHPHQLRDALSKTSSYRLL